MTRHGKPIKRTLPRGSAMQMLGASGTTLYAPRTVSETLIDFSSLALPQDVAIVLAEAFWSHFGHRPARSVVGHWRHLRTFSRFVRESRSLRGLRDIHHPFLVRFVEWLRIQRQANGKPLRQTSRAAPYVTVRVLLVWIQRCRPGVLDALDFPFNPFPGRNSERGDVPRLSAKELRKLLKACEREIEQCRAQRTQALLGTSASIPNTLGWLINSIDRDFRGLVPPASVLTRAGNYRVRLALEKHGGLKKVEPCLYPTPDSIFPYYLAIMIHSAGNPEAIAGLECDCLRPIPLLDDREMLTWVKPRAGVIQRRSFRTASSYEPPTLVRELLEWTTRLRPHAPVAHRKRLFLQKTVAKVGVMLATSLTPQIDRFVARHALPRFCLKSIRPSVLTAFYRASGDLHQVKQIANHARLSTTTRYVQGPEVHGLHQLRIGSLQSAFLGRIEAVESRPLSADRTLVRPRTADDPMVPAGPVVTMFGFECEDPYAGIAPGSRRGELCTHFLGCLTCPNAIIGADPLTLARLLQARDHLRAAAAQLHPARWQAIYAPQLHILEQDILRRFAARELANAQSLMSTLPPLADLR